MVDSIDGMGRAAGLPGGDAAPGVRPVDTDAIRADIRQTRERMSHTLDDIGERLNPNHIRQQVKQNIRDATIGRAEHMARNAANRVTETRHSLMDTIRDNPIPAAMVGIGLGWLLYNNREDDMRPAMPYRGAGTWDDRYAMGGRDRAMGMGHAADWAGQQGDSIRDRAEELTDRAQSAVGDLSARTRDAVGDVAEQTQEMVGGTMERARSMANDLAEDARYRSHRVEDRLSGAIDENPLVVGAAALAVGLAAGLAVPSTRREAALMGDARDQVVSRARELAARTTDQVLTRAQEMAQETTERVVTQAREKADEATERVQEMAERVIDETQSTVRAAAQEQGLLPEDRSSGTERTDHFRA